MAKRVLVIDFETANFSATSACAIGAILIDDGEIVKQFHSLIKPPSKVFQFTSIHGITWEQVKNSPDFKQVWDLELGSLYESADLLVAHNIGFDSRVLKATAEHHSIKLKEKPTACTVKIARSELEIKPAKLDHVCKTLEIPLQHHEALSDSLASAYIYLYAKTGKKHWIRSFEIEQPTPITKTTVKPKKLTEAISDLNSEKSKEALKALLKKTKKTDKTSTQLN